jgi:hypothetical protein
MDHPGDAVRFGLLQIDGAVVVRQVDDDVS